MRRTLTTLALLATLATLTPTPSEVPVPSTPAPQEPISGRQVAAQERARLADQVVAEVSSAVTGTAGSSDTGDVDVATGVDDSTGDTDGEGPTGERVTVVAELPTGPLVVDVPVPDLTARTLEQVRQVAAGAAGTATRVEVPSTMRALTAPAGPLDQWPIERLDLTDAHRHATGTGVVVAVIDTAVDVTHPELTDRTLPPVDLTGDGEVRNGHGTHVAGIVATTAPRARILPVAVLDGDGTGPSSRVAQGIVAAVDHGADVINLSLGDTERTAAVDAAVRYATTSGVVVVAAAGNEALLGSPRLWPAASPGVLAVAATTPGDRRAGFSSVGDWVDVAAPGLMIRSTWPGGGHLIQSGTSMAAPFVAGTAALALDAGTPPATVPDRLLGTADDIGPAGADEETGFGLVDPVEASGGPPGRRPPLTAAEMPKLGDLPAPSGLPEIGDLPGQLPDPGDIGGPGTTDLAALCRTLFERHSATTGRTPPTCPIP